MNELAQLDLTLNASQIERAVGQAALAGRSVFELLAKEMAVDERSIAVSVAKYLDLRFFDAKDLYECHPLFEQLSISEALRKNCAVLPAGGKIWLVVDNPFNSDLMRWAGFNLEGSYQVAVALRGDLSAYLGSFSNALQVVQTKLDEKSHSEEPDALPTLSLQTISNDGSPTVQLVNSLLFDALKGGASDIHLQRSVRNLFVKYRLDGVLVNVGRAVDHGLADQVISRIKVLSELDIAERRVPQDGRFRVVYEAREVDVRVSIMPSSHGEDAVLRLLDKHNLTSGTRGLTLDSLGFDTQVISTLRQLAQEPYGMLLVTGPTGSGKTTTLYAAISEINSGQDKIVTIEDPVEYELNDVLQIQVNEKKGLTFARGLRSILRHDPDTILVGEIRDPETAQIAIQSSLTGHLVFTTVHANNAVDVIGRFVHMGTDIHSFVSALNGVVAQRLVRINCENCVTNYTPDLDLLRLSRLSPDESCTFSHRRGRGCNQCRGTGYKGRRAIGEVMTLTDEIREAIASRAPARDIKRMARDGGTQFLRDSALNLAREGLTTLEEINRVTAAA